MRGRAQPIFTNVLTPSGFRPIGELEVGDLVVGSDGRPTPVIGVYPQGPKEIYRVSTQDGASTLASADHLWAVSTRDGSRQVLETQAIVDRLRTDPDCRYELPLLSRPVEFEPREVAEGGLSPVLVGKGHLQQPATTLLAEEYLYTSASVRLATLQALLDADGEPVPQPDGTCRVSYTTTSQRLQDDIVFLVRSLGGVAFRHAAHILDIRLPAGIEPFRLPRKAEKYRAGGRPMRYIDRIEPAGTEEAVCIQVAAADSLYVTEDFLLTHNTLNDAFIILDEAQNTSPEQMKMFLTRLGFGSKIVVTGDITQVDLPGGMRSGLRVVQEILDGVDDVHFSNLTSHDVVRHKLVGHIVDAYDRWQATQDAQAEGRDPRRPGSVRQARRGR